MGNFEVAEETGRDGPENAWRADAGREALAGDVWETTTCFAVDMAWLVLSTVITASTVLVLAWTVWRGAARDEVVWKSSILPLVYYRDRMVVVRQGDGAVGIPALEEKPLMWGEEMLRDSKKVVVRFAGNGVA